MDQKILILKLVKDQVKNFILLLSLNLDISNLMTKQSFFQTFCQQPYKARPVLCQKCLTDLQYKHFSLFLLLSSPVQYKQLLNFLYVSFMLKRAISSLLKKTKRSASRKRTVFLVGVFG